MSLISPTGDGLNVLIACQNNACHDWMAFASWYSFSKNFPDAVVKVICNRAFLDREVFRWPQKTNTAFRQYYGDGPNYRAIADQIGFFKPSEQVLVIQPWVMAAGAAESEFDFSNLEIVEAKDEKTSPFVSYLNGCGKFVLNDWINSMGNPFIVWDKLRSIDVTLNEYRVLHLWEKCHKTYTVIS